MNRSQRVIIGIIGIAMIAWGINLYLYPIKLGAFPIRKELINITGVISFLMMGVIMLLAIRPKWLDRYLGLDKMYHLHKWVGIWAIVFAGLHYVIKIGKPVLQFFFEQGQRMKGARPELTGLQGWLDQYVGFAKDVGEYLVYFLLVVLVLTLWNKFSYKIWRYTHKLMAPVFLLLAIHAVVLTPWNYWFQPLGILVGLAVVIGSVCAVISMLGLIGKTSTHAGKVLEVKQLGNCIEVTCKLSGEWQHKAGQYAFFKHDRLEGAHPFTISSADEGDNVVRFSIKALGDYTKYLQNNIHAGDRVEVEGPYGLFDYQRSQSSQQVWIGGGIGITPFIAWVESMIQNNDHETQVDFYYCACNEQEADYANYLKTLCESLPNVRLHVHCSDVAGYLTADKLMQDSNEKISDIWFCGPSGFAKKLKSDLKERYETVAPNFHQEMFQMR